LLSIFNKIQKLISILIKKYSNLIPTIKPIEHSLSGCITSTTEPINGTFSPGIFQSGIVQGSSIQRVLN
jgi:hypothetical protein